MCKKRKFLDYYYEQSKDKLALKYIKSQKLGAIMKYYVKNTLKSSNIIIWGGKKYYVDEMIRKTEKYISFSGITMESKIDVELREGQKWFLKEELKMLDNPVIIIADESLECIKEKVKYLTENNLTYDHISNYGNEISIQILNALKYNDYTDLMENHIYFRGINKNGKVFIKKMNDFSIGNTIELGQISVTMSMNISLFGKCGNVKFGNSSCFQADLLINTNGSICIGDDCMIGREVGISQPDQHLIFDLITKKRININKNINIGNHVWIGRKTQILGGCVIPDNCVVGACSVTSGEFSECNCIIAGSPAVVIRHNIIWARDSQTNDYQTYYECSDQAALKYLNNIE